MTVDPKLFTRAQANGYTKEWIENVKKHSFKFRSSIKFSIFEYVSENK